MPGPFIEAPNGPNGQNGYGAPSALRLQVPAKVNLLLCVGPRRDDGYHEVASLMQAISLFDEVRLSEGPGPRPSLPSPTAGPLPPAWTDPASGSTLTVATGGAGTTVGTGAVASVGSVPAGPENLVWRATVALAERTGRLRGGKLARPVDIEIIKSIPAGGGLGGGSADAAATLVGLNLLWRLGLPAEALIELGGELGSDVPFFIYGGTALAAGRGERVLPLPAVAGWLVLANSGIVVSTPQVYRTLDEDRATKMAGIEKAGGGSWSLAARDATAWLSLRAAEPARLLGELPLLGKNDLEAPARRLEPALGNTGAAMRDAGLTPHLSGSGGTFWAPAASEGEARAAATALAACGLWSRAVEAVPFGVRPADPAGPARQRPPGAEVQDSRGAGRSN